MVDIPGDKPDFEDISIDRRTALAFGGGLVTGGYLTSLYSFSRIPELDEKEVPQKEPVDDSSGSSEQQPPPRTKNRPFLGSASAPVKIVYWGDNQCPYCQRFENRVLPTIKSEYLDTGFAVLYYKPLNLFGPDSYRAALASHSVWSQSTSDKDMFWNWFDRLSSAYSGERNSGWADKAGLTEIAKKTDGVNAEEVGRSVDNEKYRAQIINDASEGELEFDLQGTPHFVVYTDSNDGFVKIRGAQPFENFESVIEEVRQ